MPEKRHIKKILRSETGVSKTFGGSSILSSPVEKEKTP
jgi:hypothetical protein